MPSSELLKHMVELKRAGFGRQAIAALMGLTDAQVQDRMADPSAPDPTPSPGGSGGSTGGGVSGDGWWTPQDEGVTFANFPPIMATDAMTFDESNRARASLIRIRRDVTLEGELQVIVTDPQPDVVARAFVYNAGDLIGQSDGLIGSAFEQQGRASIPLVWDEGVSAFEAETALWCVIQHESHGAAGSPSFAALNPTLDMQTLYGATAVQPWDPGQALGFDLLLPDPGGLRAGWGDWYASEDSGFRGSREVSSPGDAPATAGNADSGWFETFADRNANPISWYFIHPTNDDHMIFQKTAPASFPHKPDPGWRDGDQAAWQALLSRAMSPDSLPPDPLPFSLPVANPIWMGVK